MLIYSHASHISCEQKRLTMTTKKIVESKNSLPYLHGIIQSVCKIQLLVLNALDWRERQEQLNTLPIHRTQNIAAIFKDMVSSQKKVLRKSSSKKGTQRKYFYLTCYLEVVCITLWLNHKCSQFLGSVSFDENSIISELYDFRILDLLHTSQFMVPLLETISPLETLLVC